MTNDASTCPLTQQQLVGEYFIEHRTKLLDIAAFLDRLDRAVALDATHDFRVIALRQALQLLCSDQPGRIERIQIALSDPTLELLAERDRQNAFGAAQTQER
ncbi:MAG TPA: hypothetical protein VKE41_04155 [Roseiflexaceae bacterium]|nr:hypothetical protein [Roseiflexaceae bacterium]